MWQPLNRLATRLSPPEGGTIHGVHISGGVEVGISHYAMKRRKDLFGHDADLFRPERWIESEHETLRPYERMLCRLLVCECALDYTGTGKCRSSFEYQNDHYIRASRKACRA
jgi:hypothetical protein